MSSSGPPQGSDSGLLGVEIGRNKVRLALLDWRGNELLDAVERPIAKAGGPRDPIEQEFSTRSAIEAGLARLEVDDMASLAVGATIGFPNCGVGSGPALHDWLDSLSDELDEPVLFTGSAGISYAPETCVDFVQRVFEPTGLRLARVELAPVAAARVLTSVRSGAITLGSGVAWSARLLNNQVLEAFETADGDFDSDVTILVNGVGEMVDHLDGLEIGESLGPSRGLSPAALAPSVGVAVAMLDLDGPNLLHGHRAGKADAMMEHVAGPATATAAAAAGADTWSTQATPIPDPDLPASRLPSVEEYSNEDHGGSEVHENGAGVAHAYDHQLDDPQIDDLGTIQDELRAHRSDDLTYQLRRPARTIERSRELRPDRPVSQDLRGADPEATGTFRAIEDFGMQAPVEYSSSGVPDFLIGALLMLALVLVAALVVL